MHFLIFNYCKIEINDDFQTLSLYFSSPPTPCVCYYCSLWSSNIADNWRVEGGGGWGGGVSSERSWQEREGVENGICLYRRIAENFRVEGGRGGGREYWHFRQQNRAEFYRQFKVELKKSWALKWPIINRSSWYSNSKLWNQTNFTSPFTFNQTQNYLMNSALVLWRREGGGKGDGSSAKTLLGTRS